MKLLSALSFTLQWICATFTGFLLSLLLIEIGEKPDVGVIQAIIGATAIALPQSLLLRQRIFPLWWVLSTIMAWGAIAAVGIGAVGWIVPRTELFIPRLISGGISGTIAGCTIGIAQCLAICQQVPYAWRWIIVSSFSWGMGIALGSTGGLFIYQISDLFLGEVVGLAAGWLLVSIFTGIYGYIMFGQVQDL
jgi:hypothetical protein